MHPDDDVYRVERELAALTRHPDMGAFSAGASSAGGLERGTYLLLSQLDEAGPMSIKELTRAFRLDTSTINRHTAAMTRAGLLERIPDPEGGIARKFRVTPHGSERLQAHRTRIVGGLTRVVADWTPAEFDALAASLAHLNASIERLRRTHDPARDDDADADGGSEREG